MSIFLTLRYVRAAHDQRCSYMLSIYTCMTFCRMDLPAPAPQRVRIVSQRIVSVGVHGGVSNGILCDLVGLGREVGPLSGQ
jgi:hypothetical protein